MDSGHVDQGGAPQPFAAGALADAAHELGGHLGGSAWTEIDPGSQVLQRLRVAADLPGSPWRLHRGGVAADGSYVLDVSHANPRTPRLLADAIALLASVAGPVFLVRQTDAVTIECATGALEDDGPATARGILVRLRMPNPEENGSGTPHPAVERRLPQPFAGRTPADLVGVDERPGRHGG